MTFEKRQCRSPGHELHNPVDRCRMCGSGNLRRRRGDRGRAIGGGRIGSIRPPRGGWRESQRLRACARLTSHSCLADSGQKRSCFCANPKEPPKNNFPFWLAASGHLWPMRNRRNPQRIHQYASGFDDSTSAKSDPNLRPKCEVILGRLLSWIKGHECRALSS